MKKIFALGLMLMFLGSCDVSDDDASFSFSFEVLPIESVDIPDQFELGAIHPITVSYLRPSTCHSFRDFYYVKENNERTVAVVSTDLQASDCQDLTDELVEATFNFKVNSNGSYIFRFWQGEDENEVDQYLIIEVPVVE